jgi:hypothetical protein
LGSTISRALTAVDGRHGACAVVSDNANFHELGS